MEFGISFFPNVGPHEKSAARYWDEALQLVDLCDGLGYSHVRTVEHYFHPYGGYTPNPIVFLAAASQRTRHARLVTGAVLPAFNNPLKVAGEAGMLDAISGGRLDLGLARAFLPHEFARFGVSLDESRARYEEGVEQIRRLLAEENLSMTGAFHSFTNVTSLPRPTQKPHPPIWVAALSTPETFEYAGRNGFHCMANPIGGSKLNELFGVYRDAWKSAGHAGHGQVAIAFMMYCAPTTEQAIAEAAGDVKAYFQTLADAASDWTSGASTKDYPGYDKMIEVLSREDVHSQRAKSAAFVGSPEEIRDMIADFARQVGGFDIASMQINTKLLDVEKAKASMRLFSQAVMPHFTGSAPPPATRRHSGTS
jgi:alkanesulfonate monooxygenase SsuD/methylene tetrahydromethanopterin reductase-like flavin-dependent oxidoreductase (luciferase family)